MKPSKPGPRAGGATKEYLLAIVNITLFTSVGGVNLIDQIIKGQSLIGRWDKTFLLFAIAALCFVLWRKKKFFAYLYAFMSILALVTTEESANLTGMIFLIFSLVLFRTDLLISLITLITFIGIGSKAFVGFSGNQIIGLTIGYIYCLINYYILIHPKSDNEITVICPELDSETVKMLQKLYLGCSVKEISVMLYLSEAAVSKRIGRARQAMGAKSTAHLLAICREKGYIRLNLDISPKP